MRKFFYLIVFLISGAAAYADGMAAALADPPVVQIIRAPDVVGAPLSVTGAGVTGHVQGQMSGIGSRFAWDHILVGAAILGVMYMLGEDASAGSTF